MPSENPPDLESWDGESRAERVKDYRNNVKEIRDAFGQLEVLIRDLPDRAAELVAKQMNDEVESGIEE